MGTKLSAATLVDQARLTDKIAILKSGQASNEKFVETPQQLYDLFNLDFFGFDLQAMIRNPFKGVYFFSDFTESHLTQLGGGQASGGARVNGTYLQSAGKSLGVQSLAVNTGGLTRVQSALSAQGVVELGRGKCLHIVRVAPDILSTSGEEYHYELGFTSGYGAGAGFPNGIFWCYQRSVDGDFWVTGTQYALVATKNVTSIPVTTDYIWLAYTVNAAFTEVKFYYSTDGVTWTLAQTHTTNIPTSGFYTAAIIGQMGKIAGNTYRYMNHDLALFAYEMTRGV